MGTTLRTDLEIGHRWIGDIIKQIGGININLDAVPPATESVACTIIYLGLAEPINYVFGGDYDWSSLIFQVDLSAITEDYADLWAKAALVHAGIHNTYSAEGATNGGTVYDVSILVPYEQAEVAPGQSIKRVGAKYVVKAKANTA